MDQKRNLKRNTLLLMQIPVNYEKSSSCCVYLTFTSYYFYDLKIQGF